MGKEQMGREEGGLTTNEARKRFGGRKRGGHSLQRERTKRWTPKYCSAPNGGGGSGGQSWGVKIIIIRKKTNTERTKIRGLIKSLYTKLVRTSQDTVINIHRVQGGVSGRQHAQKRFTTGRHERSRARGGRAAVGWRGIDIN